MCMVCTSFSSGDKSVYVLGCTVHKRKMAAMWLVGGKLHLQTI